MKGGKASFPSNYNNLEFSNAPDGTLRRMRAVEAGRHGCPWRSCRAHWDCWTLPSLHPAGWDVVRLRASLLRMDRPTRVLPLRVMCAVGPEPTILPVPQPSIVRIPRSRVPDVCVLQARYSKQVCQTGAIPNTLAKEVFDG